MNFLRPADDPDRRIAMPAVVFVLGLCLSAFAAWQLQRNIDTQATADFQRNAERVADEVSRRVRQPVYGLMGAKGMYAANPTINRAAFGAYVASRDLPREFPGVRGFGFLQHVAPAGLKAFEAAEQADGAPGFSLRGSQNGGSSPAPHEHWIIQYMEPAADHVGLPGLDVGADGIRSAAIERAVATGQPALTALTTLMRRHQRTPGYVLYLPVFRAGVPLSTPAERHTALLGLLFAPLVLDEALSGELDVSAGLVDFALFDDAQTFALGQASFDTAVAPAGAASQPSATRARSRFEAVRTLPMLGREWTMRVRSKPGFEASHANATPWAVLAGGALVSLLLAGLLHQQASGRRRAEALAKRMTADLDRLAQVARHTTNAVSITDGQSRITWVNDGFTRLSGYTLHDALGQTLGDLLGSGEADAAAPPAGASAAAGDGDVGCRRVMRNRHKDGGNFWLDLDVQPLLDAQGALTGCMQIGTEVTAQRQAQARLESALRDTDALLRVINMHAIVSVADRAGRIVEANDAFCRISGYSREELLQQTHRIVNSGVQPASFWVEMWRTIAAGTPWHGEVCNRSKDGQMYWVDTLIAPFVDADGQIEKYISIRTDITASKNATRELARQSQRLNNILEGTNVGTWEWNVETGVTVFNERWAQIVGYSLTELMPTTVATWSCLTHPDDMSRASVQLERHFNGEVGVYEYEARLKHKAGHWVWVLGRGKLFSRSADGRPRWMAGTLMDITERKQAETALIASQALLDKTGRIAGVGGWAFELAPQAIRWSDQTCRIHGCEPGHQPGLEEAIGYYAPEARAVVAQAVRRCIDSGEAFDLELPLVTAQGRAIWVRFLGELETADGRPLRLLGTLQDVTAQHQLEAEVRRKSDLITSVIENLPCGLSVYDADLNLVTANGAFRRLLDLPDRLFEGPSACFEDVIRFNAERGEYGPGDAQATARAIVERARHSNGPHLFERVRPNGMHLEVRGGPMPGGGFVTTYTDISARKRAEAEVQRASALLRGSIDALEDAYALFDVDDRMVLCNQRYRDLYPLIGELMQPGMPFEDIVRAGAERGQYADAVGRVEAFVAERLAAHRQPSSTVTRRLGDGRILRIGERRMDDGHTVGFHVDITEFVHATEAAQEASRSKSQFLANMSHEIRTPMNAILGMLALLKKTGLTARQADYAGKTEGAARSLLGLLNDILDFSKVEAGKMTLDPHPFRSDQLMRDLAVILAANTAGKPIEVLFDIDPRLPRLLVGDAMRLQQVLINLGGNAVKFTAEGEVVIAVTVIERRAETAMVEFAVRDSGIGIAAEHQQRIFSGFSQAEASTTRRYGGTGLGLAICQRLVTLMGAELQVDSEVGRGSRFHFRVELAVADDHADAQAELAPQRARQAVALRVLLVDDNPRAREVLGRMAQALGWQATLADSGAAALACLQDEGAAFDVVFIDWQMPGLDGWQTCQQIRQRCRAGTTPLLIMVTAHGLEVLSQRSPEEQALVDGFLVKPVTASMLYDAVVDARNDPHAPVASRHAAPASAQRLAGMRLLVVEDNANNQQVARELLEDEGAEVLIAANGLLAVEAVAAADPPFDVVLMDLQMPVMDGYTATSRIRQDLKRLALPIVAMTANAMAADREACLAAGMNDHVGKPFDLDPLVALLLRLAGRAAAASGRQAPAAATALPPQILAAAGAAGVDIDRALARLGGKLKVYGRTLRSFTTDLGALPQQMDSQLQRGDRDGLRRELHSLKGVAATVGVSALARLAGDAEAQLAAQWPAADEAACVARLGAAIDAAAASLALLCDALDGGQGATADAVVASVLTPAETAQLAILLRAVQGLLRASDLDAAEALRTLRARLPAAAGPRLDALESAVESLEFETALSHCDAWLLECVA